MVDQLLGWKLSSTTNGENPERSAQIVTLDFAGEESPSATVLLVAISK
jgi:hypothetical protein